MESLAAGTLAGTGSFRCEECGHIVTLAAHDGLPDCPGCGGRSFARASLFTSGRAAPATSSAPTPDERAALIAGAQARMTGSADHLAWREGDSVRIVALERELTRVGRSLAADVRFDDPTVSRRHALVVRETDAVRLLDDRSLNGVFVNGERVDCRTLAHGDEIVIGRYRMIFLQGAREGVSDAGAPLEAAG